MVNNWSKDVITMFINIHKSDTDLPIYILVSNNHAFAGAPLLPHETLDFIYDEFTIQKRCFHDGRNHGLKMEETLLF